MKAVIVTGAAGFVGFHVAKRWLHEGWKVVGLDAVTDYYEPALKRARLSLLTEYPGFEFVESSVVDFGALGEPTWNWTHFR